MNAKKKILFLSLFFLYYTYPKDNKTKNDIVNSMKNKYECSNNQILFCDSAQDFASFKFVNVCKILNAFGKINLTGTTTINGILNLNIQKMNVNSPLEQSGIVNVKGAITAEAFHTFSDIRLKEKITNINTEESLDKIIKLKPKTFFYKKEAQKKFGFNDKKQRGFLAQEIKKVLPNSVFISKEEINFDNKIINNLHKINSDSLIPDLVGALQECIKKINKLEKKIEKLNQNNY